LSRSASSVYGGDDVADRRDYDETPREPRNDAERRSEESNRGTIWAITAVAVIGAIIAVAFFLPMFTRDPGTTVVDRRTEGMITDDRRIERETHITHRVVQLGDLGRATPQSNLIGERVRLENVPVLMVVDPGVFWVGDTEDTAVLVTMGGSGTTPRMEPQAGARDGIGRSQEPIGRTPGQTQMGGQDHGTLDGRMHERRMTMEQVRVGDRITLTGMVSEFPPEDQARQRWNLGVGDMPADANTNVYLMVEEIWEGQSTDVLGTPDPRQGVTPGQNGLGQQPGTTRTPGDRY
jgi:hypothetical protein